MLKIEIDENKIIKNYEMFKTTTNFGDNLIPVLKASSYALSNEFMVKLLKAKKYFIYSVDEGVEIRKLDSKAEIFVLSSLMSQDADIFIKYNLTPIINSMDELKLCPLKDIVLQFNTGMNRCGIELNEIESIKDYTSQNKNVVMIMSHFCCADEKEHPMNQIQIKNFEKVVAAFPNAISCFQASDAMLNFDLKYMCNAGRLGYFLYYPRDNFVFTIKADVQNSVLKAGLNDGLMSSWAKNGYVLVNDKKVKIKNITDTETFLEDTDGTEAIIVNQQIYPDFCDFCGSDGLEEIPRMLAKKVNKNIEGQKIIQTEDALYSQIMETREITDDGFVGYSATREVKKGDKLAVFAGGYLDGIYKKLSNSGAVAWIENTNGDFVPCEYYGKISMDQSIVKINADIRVGAKVIIYDKEHPIKEIGISKKEMFFMLDRSERVRHV